MKRRKTVAQLRAMSKRSNRFYKMSNVAVELSDKMSDRTHDAFYDAMDQVSNLYCYWEDKGNSKKMKRYANEIKQIEELIRRTN